MAFVLVVSANAASEGPQKNWFGYEPIVVLTAVLALSTLALVIIYAYIAWQTKRSVDIAADTAQRELRAYVNVDSAKIDFERPSAPEVTVVLRNFGQTPAYDMRQWIHIWIEEYPLRVDLPTPPADFRKAKDILAPRRRAMVFITKDPPVSAEEVPLLGTLQGTIYVYGEVRYRDAFGHDRWTKYRLIYGGLEGVRPGLLEPDTEGNEAN
jgi:hypothetical protein